MGYRRARIGDGIVEFQVSGPAHAPGLLVFHVGSPSAAVVYPGLSQAAARHGLQTLTYSRPGYARSTRAAGRREADEAARTAALADLLGHRTFLVAGWSGGGPPALACAALLPDRVLACLTIASPAPRREASPDWNDWISAEDRHEFELHDAGRWDEVEADYEEGARLFGRIAASRLARRTNVEANRETLLGPGGIGGPLARSMRRAVSNGIWGWLDDAVALGTDWGFRVRDVAVPVVVRHGELDALVDVRHARWLAATIPGARAEIVPGAGHSSIIEPFDHVVETLVSQGR